MAGLAPQNIRLHPDADDTTVKVSDIVVEVQEKDDEPDIDADGNIMRINHGDGSVTISLDGRPLNQILGSNSGNIGWFDNLVEHLGASEAQTICDDLLRGIDEDLQSRKDWVEDRANGLKLLGLKLEVGASAGSASAGDSAPVEGMSKVRHPLLLEAVLRFQANAYAEMLPADGPVKIRNDDLDGSPITDADANALEKEFNNYLTSGAPEYYPDTDRMYLLLGFGGTQFKKVYRCPLRQRPVSETVDADDLIVNQSATDLTSALRVTHRTYVKASVIKRMQIIGVYRDVDLGSPGFARNIDAVQRQEKEIEGVASTSSRPEDQPREIYECYCELNLPGFEHKMKGKETGLPLPYRVTIDVASRQILAISRNWDEPESDNDLPVAKKVFVKYTFVPGMGFYDLGLLNILGNTTNAVTAAWRELLDAGMFSNFPGFLVSEEGGRQNTNIFRVPPGGGAQIKTGGKPINQAVMPLPYQQPSVALMQLVQNIAETGMRIGGTSEQAVGEGRSDAPVGTTLAMIEQAVKVMNSVHKRMHTAQAQEFQLLLDLFRQHPEDFLRLRKRDRSVVWTTEKLLQALDNYDLVPRADPNTSSFTQRIMKVWALKELEKANPSLYDPIAIDMLAIRSLGYSNPQQFMAPPQAQAAPPPQLQEMQAKMKSEQETADAKMITAQAKQAEVQAKIQQGAYAPKQTPPAAPQQPEQIDPIKVEELKIKAMDAQTRQAQMGLKHSEQQMEDQNRDLDRQSRERVQLMELARDVALHPDEQAKPEGNKDGDT